MGRHRRHDGVVGVMAIDLELLLFGKMLMFWLLSEQNPTPFHECLIN